MKLQHFAHLMRRVDSLENSCWEGLGGGGDGGDRGWDGWMASLTRWTWTPGTGDGQGGLVCCNSWGRKELDTTEWLNWTELNWTPHNSVDILQGLKFWLSVFQVQPLNHYGMVAPRSGLQLFLKCNIDSYILIVILWQKCNYCSVICQCV